MSRCKRHRSVPGCRSSTGLTWGQPCLREASPAQTAPTSWSVASGLQKCLPRLGWRTRSWLPRQERDTGRQREHCGDPTSRASPHGISHPSSDMRAFCLPSPTTCQGQCHPPATFHSGVPIPEHRAGGWRQPQEELGWERAECGAHTSTQGSRGVVQGSLCSASPSCPCFAPIAFPSV